MGRPKDRNDGKSSKAVTKQACPACRKAGNDRSGNNLVVYDDGHKYCFACAHYEHGDGHVSSERIDLGTNDKGLLKGLYVALDARGISSETCERYGYQLGRMGNTVLEIANYTRDNEIVGQKVRGPNKHFSCRGQMSDAPLWGQHLWKNGGKRIVVTEGEIDCMSAYQALGGTWPVVSVPSGASGAADSFRRSLEFLNSYETVVICFDSDEPGKKAALECALLLRPGIAAIATLPLKDPNEMLLADRAKELTRCLWEAQTYRPEGVVHVRDVSMAGDSIGRVFDYPWDNMNRSLYGRRSGELVVHTSGSGMGKSTVMREMIWYDLQQGYPVGVMMLEEGTRDTVHDLISLKLNKPVRKIFASRKINAQRASQGKEPLDFGIVDDLSDEEFNDAHSDLLGMGLYLLDHFGSTDVDLLISKMNYMTTGMGCQNLYLDHLSIIISGQDGGNERKEIDLMMTQLRTFVEGTDCHVDAVCHLTKPKTTPFEEGGQISLRDLRGSGTLYQLADSVIGYERNQQHPDPALSNTIAVRSLKDRFSGKTGIIEALQYDITKGRLRDVKFEVDAEGNVSYPNSSGVLVSHDTLYGKSEDDPTDPLL